MLRLSQAIVLALGLFMGRGTAGVAQDSATLVVSARADRRLDAATRAVLERRIALHLEQVRLDDALATIAEQARVRLAYSPDQIPPTQVVSLVVREITVGEALRLLLRGTGLVATVPAPGRLMVGPTGPDARAAVGAGAAYQPGSGRLMGRVTDVQTAQGLPQATVVIESTTLRAATNGAGEYTIVGVPAGSYRVTARMLGHVQATKSVTIGGDSTVRLDFALIPVAATLSEVVTTGAGQQRRVELGNAIAVINADSVRKVAPVTDITDLISGRVPNVQVLASSGIVGSDPAIRIRGRSSIGGSNDPIVFIDGVRIDAAPSGITDVFGGGASNPAPSRLNDLNPNELESIEVLRGPSAATEYGTDAANGVIVIKTKRGQVGPPRWDFGTEQGITTMPVTFPLQYHSWGHTTDGTNTPTACPFVNSFGGASRYAGTCAVDSITTWQPLNHSATSLFGNGGRHAYNLQFSEGTPRVRYFASGDVSDELGVLRMPPSEQLREEKLLNSPIPGEARYPNAEQRVNLRGQATGTIGSSAEASASTAYLSTTQRAPDPNFLLFNVLAVGPGGYRDAYSGYGPYYPPGAEFLHRDIESVSRFVGGLSSTWHPAGWLSLRGTGGVDNAGRTDEGLLVANQVQTFLDRLFFPGGYRSTGNYRTSVYTADVGAVATVQLTSQVGSKTAAGVQYYDTRNRGTAVAVTNIGIGNPTLNGGSIYQNNAIQERGDEALTLGTYLDETISLAEQLYLTGAVRLDAGSGFGKQYHSALYPKASLSWVLSPEPHNLLRLRAAYGQSGVQPPPGAALRLYAPLQGYANGTFAAGDTVSAYGNGRLRPERSSEIETGADIGLFRNRLTVELTGYVKTTTDAIVTVPIEASLGGGSLQENLGEVRNRGVEASLTGHPIDSRALALDFTLSGSVNDNKVVTLGPGVLPIDQSSQFQSPYRQAPGYPLYGFWAVPLTYRDLNHDGIIEPNEFTVGDSVTFQGSSIPIRELSLNTGVSFLNHRIRVSAQVDHRGGQKLVNTATFYDDLVPGRDGARDLNSPRGVPLWVQARAVESATNAALFRVNSGNVEDASFTRWRELSVAYSVPERLAAAVHARSASVTLAVRNLALWTHYTGPDPEVNSGGSANFTVAGQRTTAVNYDVVADVAGMPQTRYWVLKLALGL